VTVGIVDHAHVVDVEECDRKRLIAQVRALAEPLQPLLCRPPVRQPGQGVDPVAFPEILDLDAGWRLEDERLRSDRLIEHDLDDLEVHRRSAVEQTQHTQQRSPFAVDDELIEVATSRKRRRQP